VRSSFFAVAVAFAAVAAACSSGPALIDYPTPKVSATTTSTTAFDYEGVALPAVPGRTTTTVDNRPGKANLAGTVTGPDGPVPMANVRVERLVQETVLGKDVVAGPDGAWRLDLVRGGRYRVRAWRAPDLAQVEPQIFYLGFDETRSLPLVVARYNGPQASALLAPSPPVINEPAALSVVVTTASVDAQGIVRGTPLSGSSVQLLAGFAEWRMESPAVQVADAGGNVMWRLTCLVLGPRPLSVIMGSGTPVTLTVPPCDDGTGAQQPPSTPAQAPRTTTTTRISPP
jgi:hypothetical protein